MTFGNTSSRCASPDGFKAQIVVVDREAIVLYRAALVRA